MTDKGAEVSLQAASNKASLKDLVLKRSSIKGQITKFKKYLGELEKLKQLSDIELAELNFKISKFEKLSVKFDDLQGEIEVLNAGNMDSEINERDLIEHEFIHCIFIAKTLAKSQTDIGKSQSQCHDDLDDSGFRLPQIQISKFDGAYFRWLEFRDTFEALIHNNNRISPIHKFHYLISYLEGDAARIISNLEVSSANYAEAWQIIYERYNNKRLLINHHLKSLFNIQPLTRESDKSLRYLVDTVTKNLRALASLDQPTDHWDILLIYMLSTKLDSQTLTKWEEYRGTLDDIPTLSQFHKFITDRADVLESLARNKHVNSVSKSIYPSARNDGSQNSSKANYHNSRSQNHSSYTKSFASTTKPQKTNMFVCIICNENHKIYDCFQFKSKSVEERLADVSKYKLCVNCLRQGHPVSDCRMGPCRECKQKHNSLLHTPIKEINTNIALDDSEYLVNVSNQSYNQVLLSTALIEVCNPITGTNERVRALLDCGSQSSFMSKSLKNRLSLTTTPINAIKVVGIGNCTNNSVNEICNVQLRSLNDSYELKLSCFVLDKITSETPKAPINVNCLNLPQGLPLADPEFSKPAAIEILIGCDAFWDILGNKQYSLGTNYPKLRSSKFGWLISGPMLSKNTQNMTKSQQAQKVTKVHCNHILTDTSQNNINESLAKFWEIEELPKGPTLSPNNKLCEKHFVENTFRLNTGRFCVRLPLLDTPDCLGNTYDLAKRRLLNLERKFRRNPSLKLEYTKFINEYAELGHLSELDQNTKPLNSYYLCHHAVLKEQSESTKLRVVFDGSAKSSSGYSLNDILMVGPNMQNSLFAILLRARQYKYIICGDIEKMYRQVQVHEDDRNLQLILWRERDSEPIKAYELNTVTYGTASASYLSTRCLWQLGEEQDDELIKTIIQDDFYMDDLITGSDDEKQLHYILNSTQKALSAGCFNLRKFKSNSPNIFDIGIINSTDNLTISESSSTLGLGWDPTSDTFNFPLSDSSYSDKITKRHILSSSFKVFDPLGLLSPCIIQPKILIQRLWMLKLDWDDCVPKDIERGWQTFSENLNYIKNSQVPRLVLCNNPKFVELHSFSDASQSAYGACIYVRSIGLNGEIIVNLLCSKSRVAPIKPVTMPRLELCAAVLAARLCDTVLQALRCKPNRVVHWCDSSIVIAWIHSNATKLKAFVANRVHEIQEKTKSSLWRYVPTSLNPADLISRGVDAQLLVASGMWWHGPEFLSKAEFEWPNVNPNNKSIEILPELKSHSVVISEPIINFERFSKLDKLINTFAYVRRFLHNLKNPKDKYSGPLSLKEVDEAFLLLCIMAQKQSFPIEYEMLYKNKELSSKSKILSLSPFMVNNIIRVGGRLNASSYPFDKRHPILLHASHYLTKLYFERAHMQNLHAGPQLLLASVRDVVWPVNGRQLARRVTNRCVVCRRARGKTLCPKMGDLPVSRVTPNFPFLSVGIDFAGPFYILNRKGRGGKLVKSYLCVFVCLRYKCLHLEAVSDLSKNAFIMTLRRFIARRGKPLEIFCDNGGNFVASAKEIKDFFQQNKDNISNFANQEKIHFNFSPAYAPHFGGIWEAGVKSAKFHLKRVVGNSHLTFEEILTLFAQIESALNSRPLCPLSCSPNDFLYLSPGHFLIGRPMNSLPSPDMKDAKETSLQRYNRIEKIYQHFWHRWQKEYISELQQRTKWRKNSSNLKVGDLVILKEDSIPPMAWRLGRVARLYPGPDNISRVADVNTSKGTVRRALIRLCLLPVEEE